MNKKQQTIDTYNLTADNMAEKFDNLGARVEDIDETFKLVPKENPSVLEIGCGNGRDAKEIVKRTNNYLGIDVALKFIEIAKENVPEGKFEVADIENYTFPKNLDIAFAFASLIHVPKDSFEKVLRELYSALNTGGVARLSMKYSEVYKEIEKEDEFGIRTYYLYSKEDIERFAGNFNIIKNETNELRGQTWLEVLLQK
ncbi:MAG: methyltransferase domain-containing protein [Patescibacteria group bacterium]